MGAVKYQRQDKTEELEQKELREIQKRQQLEQERQEGTGIMPENYVETTKMRKVIGKEEVQKASETLKKYREGKSNLENRIVENEQWWKLRHWEIARNEEGEKHIEPVSYKVILKYVQ